MLVVKSQKALKKIWDADTGDTLMWSGNPCAIVAVRNTALRMFNNDHIFYVIPSKSLKKYYKLQLDLTGISYLKESEIPKAAKNNNDMLLKAYLVHRSECVVYCDQQTFDYLK
jgi:hypothetical protein